MYKVIKKNKTYKKRKLIIYDDNDKKIAEVTPWGGWLKNWYNTDSIQSIISNSFDLIANHCGMILNPIFNECKQVNIIYSILDDLTVNRSVYNDIENFLWANKQEPISEPDNKTKIINHGFDLKTSFRKI